MKFGLIANRNRPGVQNALKLFLDWAKKSDSKVLLDENLSDLTADGLSFAPIPSIAGAVDVIVSMGGDGTLLSVARAVGDAGTPILGINIGSLGFMTQLSPTQLPSALDAILAGDYKVEKRMILKAQIEDNGRLEFPYALNDIVIDNGPISRLIDISMAVNGEEIVTYRADGLVISTPTGSTAYNLAVGGPIVNPNLEAMIAAPISSFSLNTRPMIFPESYSLEITVGSQHGVAGLTLDGQVAVELKDGDKVTISRADFSSRFIVFPGNTFYKVLRNKLHWGVRPHSD
jgi:NAD+ kinase